jgi:hypothetical protein
VFAIASGYGRPPMEVSHGGGIFTTRILERESDDALRLVAENQRVMAALGMVRGVSHTNSSRRNPMAASIFWRLRPVWEALTSWNL